MSHPYKDDTQGTEYAIEDDYSAHPDEFNPIVTADEMPLTATVTAKERSTLQRLFIFLEYPWSVWFILGQEFCERFAFYGFKAILATYLVNRLHFTEDHATVIVHTFIFGAYFTPLFGGWLADSILGKFWTILTLSIVYCIGQIVISITAFPEIMGENPHWWGMALGLFLVAWGTGGIKPCVSSFGGDQFKSNQTELLSSFFAIFYLSINIGSTFSTYIVPEVNKLYGPGPAFAIPAGLLIFATILFVFGRPFYFVQKTGKTVYMQVAKVITHAIKNRNHPDYKHVGHWVERAEATIDKKEVFDVKCVLDVLPVLVPIMCFWALYDQHSSRWVFQAIAMDRTVFGYEIAPEQINILNPVMIVFMTPLFDRVVYPFINKYYNFLPLRRIAVGFVITALSFILSGVLQVFIDLYPNKVPVVFMVPQYFVLCAAEILVSITGLELAYSQAPKSMKSAMQAFYLLSVAFGNIIVVASAGIASAIPKFPFKQAVEFFVFTGLILAALGFFLIIAIRYKYKTFDDDEDNETSIQNKDESENDALIKDHSTAETIYDTAYANGTIYQS